MSRKFRILAILALLLLCSGQIFADIRMPAILTDNMIIQRDRPTKIWGWAESGEIVKVNFAGENLSAVAAADGTWMVELCAHKAEKSPRQITVEGKNKIILKNVVIGDVWLCSGQSNMEWALGGCNDPVAIESAEYPELRFITLPVIGTQDPQSDAVVRDGWRSCSPTNAASISAVGFYFGRRIQQGVDVPIGLLISSAGGTNIEKWIPREVFAQSESESLKEYNRNIELWLAAYRKEVTESFPGLEKWLKEAKMAVKDGGDIPAAPQTPLHPFMHGSKNGGGIVCHLYNAMISPLLNYAIKGALWYQGESNPTEGDSYRDKQREMVSSWRKGWGYDFPFYYVQLANFQESNDSPDGGKPEWQFLRMAQTESMNDLPNMGMCVAIDLGEQTDIHPKNKKDVGERLALWALNRDYGQRNLVVSGPIYSGIEIQGNRAAVSFDYVGSGLIVGRKDGRDATQEVKGGSLARFAIAGVDKKWYWADAVIKGDKVIVCSPNVQSPVAVRYAFSMNPNGANLYNSDGLPASPFRTDRW